MIIITVWWWMGVWKQPKIYLEWVLRLVRSFTTASCFRVVFEVCDSYELNLKAVWGSEIPWERLELKPGENRLGLRRKSLETDTTRQWTTILINILFLCNCITHNLTDLLVLCCIIVVKSQRWSNYKQTNNGNRFWLIDTKNWIMFLWSVKRLIHCQMGHMIFDDFRPLYLLL